MKKFNCAVDEKILFDFGICVSAFSKLEIETHFRVLGEIYPGEGTVFTLDSENQIR